LMRRVWPRVKMSRATLALRLLELNTFRSFFGVVPPQADSASIKVETATAHDRYNGRTDDQIRELSRAVVRSAQTR
jgi:hypothetical protein